MNSILVQKISEKDRQCKESYKISNNAGLKFNSENLKLKKIINLKEKEEYQKIVNKLKLIWDEKIILEDKLLSERRSLYEIYKPFVEEHIKTINIDNYKLVVRENHYPQIMCNIIGDGDSVLTNDEIINIIFKKDLVCSIFIERFSSNSSYSIKGIWPYIIKDNKLYHYDDNKHLILIRSLI